MVVGRAPSFSFLLDLFPVVITLKPYMERRRPLDHKKYKRVVTSQVEEYGESEKSVFCQTESPYGCIIYFIKHCIKMAKFVAILFITLIPRLIIKEGMHCCQVGKRKNERGTCSFKMVHTKG